MNEADDDLAIAARKARIRRALRERRARFVAGLAPSARTLAFRTLPRSVIDRFPVGGTVALYHAIGDEAPTLAIAERLLEAGFALSLPRMEFVSCEISLAAWSPADTLVPGLRHIPEPALDARGVEPQVIVAPLIGFDAALNRIGQGGGHYDRAFAGWPDALRIGLAWSAQYSEEAIPTEPTDVALDLVVTEAAIHERIAD